METPSVGFFEAGKLFFDNYANFEGRARRSEFWKGTFCVSLMTSLGFILLTILFSLLGEVGAFLLVAVYCVWPLILLVPSLSICVRRLHDTGHSGWWYLLFLVPLGSIVLFVFYCMDSVEENKWGPNPKQATPNEMPVWDSYASPVQDSSAAPVQEVVNPIGSYPPANQAVEATVYEPAQPQLPDPEPQANVTLYLYAGPMAGTSFRNPVGRTVTIGRNPSKCDIVLNQYEVVSGAHCQIGFFADYITVTDLNSTNGTYVNGTRLMPHTPVSVRNGATIHLANATCAFQVRFG